MSCSSTVEPSSTKTLESVLQEAQRTIVVGATVLASKVAALAAGTLDVQAFTAATTSSALQVRTNTLLT